jgi:GTP cyclohydrolase I
MGLLLSLLVPNPYSEEFKDTPKRAADWFKDFAREPNYQGEFETFLGIDFESPHQELVMVKNMHWVALCPHHLLPYSGSAAIGYLPGNHGGGYKVVGISKLARALWYWTHYPVKQEDATSNIADALMTHAKAAGAMVVLEARHTCMAERGVMQPEALTVTSAARGHFQTDAGGVRQEFLRLMK